MPNLSIVIPVYFNEENLPITYKALKDELDKRQNDLSYEMIFVDDGSGDRSFEILRHIQKKDKKVRLVRLSRNYGSQMAILAGIKNATGDCIGCISADLQEPPELIPRLYDEWLCGYEIVIAAREDREDSLVNKLLSNLFYFVFRTIVSTDMPKYGYDLFLLDKKVANALSQQKLNNVGLIGQLLQMGYRRKFIPYVRQARKIGKSKFTFAKKFKLAIDNIVNFSYIPLRVISTIGIISSFLSGLFIFYIIINRLFFNIPVQGYATITVLISFFSGLILFSLGIIGEYIWRIFDVAKNSPEFLVKEKFGFDL